MCSDPTLDVTSCSLAEMLSEPMLEAPLCIGLYGKWGNNVALMLQKIRGKIEFKNIFCMTLQQKNYFSDQIELFSCPLAAGNKDMFWLTLSLIIYIAVVLSTLIAFLFKQRLLAGLCTFFIIISITFFVLGVYYNLFCVGIKT